MPSTLDSLTIQSSQLRYIQSFQRVWPDKVPESYKQCICRDYNDNSQRTSSYAANVPTTSSLGGGNAGANTNPSGVTLTGPGGNSVSLGRRMLR